MLNEYMKKISYENNEQEISQEFLMKKDGFDIIFKFYFFDTWKLESISINKPSTHQQIFAPLIINQNNPDLFNMYLKDSYGGVIRHIERRNYTPDPESKINLEELHLRKVKDDIYEYSDIIIKGDEPSKTKLIVYDPQEKYLLKGGLTTYKKIPAPASIIFELDLPDLLTKMADSAYKAFMSEIKEPAKNYNEKSNDINLKDIDIDLSELSSWFDKERREFNGYGYLREENEDNATKVNPRDIAEAVKDREIGSSEYSQVAKALKNNINPKSVGENSGVSDGRK